MTILPFVPAVIIAIALIALLASGYVKAPPDVAYIISGLHKKPRILVGKAGIKIPFLERMDKLALGAIQIDVKTGSAVPTAEYINVRVDSTVSVRVGQSEEMIALAAQNFLNVSREQIAQKINDLLEGNIREIVGQMKLTEMVGDRKAFSEKVQENAVPDLARFGLELVSFNVQNFSDDNDVITNLGIDNVEQIRKDAAIAKSNAQREIAVAEAENAKASNDARVKAEEEIAKRNNSLAIQKAQLKQEADAKLYATQKQSEADLYERQKTAEAERFEAEQRAEAQRATAEAVRVQGEAEAAATKARGEAEAAAIQAKAEAEAEGLMKKAEAMKQYGEAAKMDMQMEALKLYFQQLPAIAQATGQAYTNVDKIVMFGDDTSKLSGNIIKNVAQVSEGLSESLGIDVKTLLTGFLGGKLADSSNKE